MVILEAAQHEDLPLLLELDACAGAHPWPESAIRRALDAGNIWLANVDAHAVGFLIEYPVLDEVTLMHLAIGRQYQGRGYGRRLLAAWLDRLSQADFCRCLLEVRAGNTPARRLYQSLGFSEMGIRRGYYPTETGFEDALVMEKSLECGIRV